MSVGFFPGWQKSLEAAGIGPIGLALITQNPQLLGESGVKGAVPATFAILVFFFVADFVDEVASAAGEGDFRAPPYPILPKLRLRWHPRGFANRISYV
jgi:hypothetical protein